MISKMQSNDIENGLPSSPMKTLTIWSFGNNSPIRDKIVAEIPSISKMELKNRQNEINLKDFVPPRKKKKLNAVNG